jgi:hypothetical protein
VTIAALLGTELQDITPLISLMSDLKCKRSDDRLLTLISVDIVTGLGTALTVDKAIADAHLMVRPDVRSRQCSYNCGCLRLCRSRMMFAVRRWLELVHTDARR